MDALSGGRLDILRTSYDSMTSFIREVEGKLDENGLWGTGFQFGDWLDPDAPADRPFDGKADRYPSLVRSCARRHAR